MKKILIIFYLIVVTLMLCISCEKKDYEYFGGIDGTATDFDSGMPISNVSVILSPGGVNKSTDVNGYYQFLNLEPGQYHVNIQHPNYTNDRKTVTVRVGENTPADFVLVKE